MARKVKHTKKHPGFSAIQRKIAQTQGVSMERAGRILAARTRAASAAAKRKNPRLKRVRGAAKRKRRRS